MDLEDARPALSFPRVRPAAGPVAAPDAIVDRRPAMVASESSPPVDQAAMSGVLEFIMDGRLPQHAKEKAELDDKEVMRELDKVLSTMSQMSKCQDATSSDWTCRWCDEENCAVHSSCIVCGYDRGSQPTESQSSDSQSIEGESNCSCDADSRDCEDSCESTRSGGSEVGEAKAPCVTGCADGVGFSWLCVYCDQESSIASTRCGHCGQGHIDCDNDGDARQRDAVDSVDRDVKASRFPASLWSCAYCGEDNRALRSHCNNCGKDKQERLAAEPLGEETAAVQPPATRQVHLCGAPPATAQVSKGDVHASLSDSSKTHWTCPACDEVNRDFRLVCHNCDRPREGSQRISASELTPGISAPIEGRPPSSDNHSAVSGVQLAKGYEPVVMKELVILHIYDVFGDERVQKVNDVFRAVGSGAFHAGVEVFGQEWSYGYTPYSTGLVYCEPKSNPAHRYREKIVMGATSLKEEDVENLLEEMAREWPGTEYDLLLHNCCHFCDAFCIKLGVGPLPVWVTNLAGVGANLVAGVSGAALAVNGIVDAAAERAAELDKRYNILSTMDSFTTQEIAIDESYFESRVQSLWTQAVQNIETVGRNIESVGISAGRAIEEVRKPRDTKEESTFSSSFGRWLSWGSSGSESNSQACTHV